MLLFVKIIFIEAIYEGGVGNFNENNPISEESLRSPNPMFWYWGIEDPKSGTLFTELELV